MPTRRQPPSELLVLVKEYRSIIHNVDTSGEIDLFVDVCHISGMPALSFQAEES